MKKIFLKKGYSIIELIVYIAIFSSLSLILMKSLMTTLSVYAASQSLRKLQTEGEFMMEKIVRGIRASESISASGNVFNSDQGSVNLINKNEDGEINNLSFSLVGENIVQNNNGVINNLNSSQISIDHFIVRPITTPVSNAVKIELMLHTTIGKKITTEFFDTVILRGK